jgi:nucleoside-diphosphate-sugar epimerase
MKALVTGDRGFIGQHLCRHLVADGWDVEGFDLLDGRDVRQLKTALPEADWCFHLAALTDARSTDLDAMLKTNVLGTLHVLRQFGDRAVFASSAAVNYPTTPYAMSKATGEVVCKAYGACIVRLCNIYGPGGHGVFEKFEAADILQIHGDGNQVRSYAPVEAAVVALMSRSKFTVVPGEDLTVNDIANLFDKPRRNIPRPAHDILDGRQILT